MGGNEGITLARVTEADLDELARLEKECFSTPWSRALFAEELKQAGICFWFKLARAGSPSFDAYMGFWRAVDEAHITNLAVRPAARGQGLGKMLVSRVLSEAKSLGCLRATLEVRESNRAAIGLYQGFGFIPVALRKKYYVDNDEDALVMIKEGL